MWSPFLMVAANVVAVEGAVAADEVALDVGV
jgi:hypothetical protein